MRNTIGVCSEAKTFNKQQTEKIFEGRRRTEFDADAVYLIHSITSSKTVRCKQTIIVA